MAKWIFLTLFVFATLPWITALIFEIWEQLIEPNLIPRHEIQAIARDLIARHGATRAAAVALINSDAYWHKCQTFEKAKWARIYREIKRQTKEAKNCEG